MFTRKKNKNAASTFDTIKAGPLPQPPPLSTPPMSTLDSSSPLSPSEALKSTKNNSTSPFSLFPPLEMIEEGSSNEEINNQKLDSKDHNISVHSPSLSKNLWTNLHYFLSPFDYRMISLFSLLSFSSRFTFLSHPSVVVFDEVIWGGMVQKYFSNTFHIDTNPPLGKLLLALAAYISGWNGSFSFYGIGADYTKAQVPVWGMRALPAVLGSLLGPMAYMTLRAFDTSPFLSGVGASLVVFENSFLTISRLILLDPIILFSHSAIILSYALQRLQNRRLGQTCSDMPPTPFFASLFLEGISLGLLISTNAREGVLSMIGLSLLNLKDLWSHWTASPPPGARKEEMKSLCKRMAIQIFSRLSALLVIPFTIYLASFAIHSSLLYRAGKDNQDSKVLTIEYQQSLSPPPIPPTMEEVYYGSVVRIRQRRMNGHYLHSHDSVYPAGSQQQQVNGYPAKDPNNLWIVRRDFVTNSTYEVDADGNLISEDEQSKDIPLEDLEPLLHGDHFRLEHLSTGRFLHSHQVDPPLSNKEKQHEVSCYGHNPSRFSDGNDNWKIEIVNSVGDSITPEEDGTQLLDRMRSNVSSVLKWKTTTKVADQTPVSSVRPAIRTLRTHFRLRHIGASCYLHSRNKLLPSWSFNQNEMTCGTETLRKNQIFFIESASHPSIPPSEEKKVSLKPLSFWNKFVEYNSFIWSSKLQNEEGFEQGNNAFQSGPLDWPLARKVVGFWSGDDVPLPESRRSEKIAAFTSEAEQDRQIQRDQREHERITKLYYDSYQNQKIYLVGNPVVWYLSFAAIIGISLALLSSTLFGHLQFKDISDGILGSLRLDASIPLLIYYSSTYIPFFFIGAGKFLQNYLPSLYSSLLLSVVLFDSITRKNLPPRKIISPLLRGFISALVIIAAVAFFVRLAPLSYGFKIRNCRAMEIFSTWNLNCASASSL